VEYGPFLVVAIATTSLRALVLYVDTRGAFMREE